MLLHAAAMQTRVVRKDQTDGGRLKHPQIACAIVATEMWQRTTPAALSGIVEFYARLPVSGATDAHRVSRKRRAPDRDPAVTNRR